MLAITQADGFAITMIAILATSFGFLAAIVLVMVRNARKHASDDDQIPGEIKPAQATSRKAGKKQACKAWEKEADWWKS